MPPKKAPTSAGTTGATAASTTGTSVSALAGTPPGTPTGSTGMAARTQLIDYIIWLCDFPEDSTMVKFIDQQQWTKLIHVTTIGVDEVKDFYTVRNDGVTFEAKPMMIHLRIFKCFLLYYKRKSRVAGNAFTEDEVLSLSRVEFHDYCSSDNYTEDLAAGGSAPKTTVVATTGSSSGLPELVTVQEFRRGVKRDKTHYEDLKDDKYFSSWDHEFVATLHMHHTHLS